MAGPESRCGSYRSARVSAHLHDPARIGGAPLHTVNTADAPGGVCKGAPERAASPDDDSDGRAGPVHDMDFIVRSPVQLKHSIVSYDADNRIQ